MFLVLNSNYIFLYRSEGNYHERESLVEASIVQKEQQQKEREPTPTPNQISEIIPGCMSCLAPAKTWRSNKPALVGHWPAGCSSSFYSKVQGHIDLLPEWPYSFYSISTFLVPNFKTIHPVFPNYLFIFKVLANFKVWKEVELCT